MLEMWHSGRLQNIHETLDLFNLVCVCVCMWVGVYVGICACVF